MMVSSSSDDRIAEGAPVASPALGEFVRTLTPGRELIRPWSEQQPLSSNMQAPRRVNLDQDKKKNGLAQLVLTVIKLLHELLEKQALRRIDGGSLTDEEIERLGFTLMRQSEELARISREFGLKEEDLNLDLGPLGKLL
jgi:hypothetical protein